MDAEEYRLMDGWGQYGKRGSHRLERSPLSPPEMIFLKHSLDYQKILPPLPETFTRKDAAKALRLSPSKTGFAVTVLKRSGVIEQIGTKGRTFLYELAKLA